MPATGSRSRLAGIETVLVGRFVSMPQADLGRLVRQAGGRVVELPTRRTRWVFVGEAASPLREDGHLPRALVRAHELSGEGVPLRIASESALIESLGLVPPEVRLDRLYTLGQLARILELPRRRLGNWVRQGLIRPARVVQGLALFEFRQAADAKALARLREAGVTPQRLRRSLALLEAWLPASGRALRQLRLFEQGRELYVETSAGPAEASGQLRLDLPMPQGPAGEAPFVPESEVWFQRGLSFEAADRLEDAVRAYARALDPEAPRADVAFNLGNALFDLKRFEEAVDCFELAAALEPSAPEAWNNLGNARATVEDFEGAVEAFKRALGLAPEYADAHFNLGDALASLGEVAAAREHWRAYLEADPSSSWAEEARARLRRTEAPDGTAP